MSAPPTSAGLQVALGLFASALILAIPYQRWIPAPDFTTNWETVAAVTSAWSVWLLARNHPFGWWIGLVGVVAYAEVFYVTRLFAEVGLQVVFFATSAQAIRVWLRGGEGATERPVAWAPRSWYVPTVLLGVVATASLTWLLMWMRGAVPIWDALTAILSLVAQVYLVHRFVESWYVWVAVDTIYVPLFASRGLYVTSVLYAVFWVMALQGLFTFRKLAALEEAKKAP